MRHLVVCCDGTWNTPHQPAVSNVRRLYHALSETDQDGNEQLAYYQPGVGTRGGNLLGWLAGGIAGVGLSRDVMDAYRWLTTVYERGDRIALFGFSRGAYTARSLAGLIAACGLLDTTWLDEPTLRRQVEHVFHRRYRQGRRADPGWRDGLRFTFDPDRADEIPVHFIGVWDTVGSLGIPDTLGWLNLLDPAHRYAFHDVRLNPHVPHARHAVALDEMRGPFTPTLWSQPSPDQDVTQVWFPGSHMDVGGGHTETGLSDGALRWMIDEAGAAGGLDFRKEMLDQIRPDALGVLHDDNQGLYGALDVLYEPLIRPLLELFFEPRPRAVPLIQRHVVSPLHASVYERQENSPITTGPYRRTTALRPGQSATVEVVAREPWNETGLYLQPGEYSFAASGSWTDLRMMSGPAGTTGRDRLRPLGVLRLPGTVTGLAERLFRRVTHNPLANFVLSRRDETLPWMALVGVVANDAVPLEGALNAHERIHIGSGISHRVRCEGYLYAFANDAWSLYGDNDGSVRLTVTRNS